jgi:two-component system phosphate regulon response regulator PhoB
VGPTVLTVDDDATLLRVLALRLELEGFQVLTADSGETALELLERRRPDAVVLDGVMPGLSGVEVCRLLREQPRGRDLPVVVLTANPSLEGEAVKAGADRFVSKPFDLDGLCGVLHALLESRGRPGAAAPGR